MRYVIIDGRSVSSMDDIHDAFVRGLDLPGYYGRNLDALHDCLTDIFEPVTIILLGRWCMEQSLGDRLDGFYRLLEDVNREKDNIIKYSFLISSWN